MHRCHAQECALMPRSARRSDSEYLAAGNHEVVRMARVPDLGQSCPEGGLVHSSRVIGAQLEPGAQARLLIVGCVVGELDAEMSPAGEADDEHRVIDAREL